MNLRIDPHVVDNIYHGTAKKCREEKVPCHVPEELVEFFKRIIANAYNCGFRAGTNAHEADICKLPQTVHIKQHIPPQP